MAGRKTAKTRKPAAGKVAIVRPDPAVWQAALMLASGNAFRLRVLDSRTVLVANHEQARGLSPQ